MRPLGPSWRLLGRTWRYLGPPLAVLEAVLDHLGRSWRPSWTILEAILGQRGHLGGHLEPSWRIFWELGDVLGVLWVVWGREIGVRQSFRVAGGTGRSPRGSSFGKRTKTKSQRIQHAGPPFGKPTGGGGSKTPTANHRRPLPFWMFLLWLSVVARALPRYWTRCSPSHCGSLSGKCGEE